MRWIYNYCRYATVRKPTKIKDTILQNQKEFRFNGKIVLYLHNQHGIKFDLTFGMPSIQFSNIISFFQIPFYGAGTLHHATD